MKVEMLKFVDANEVAREVERQFGLDEGDISLFELFGEYCENGSYQALYFDKEHLEYERSDMEDCEEPEDEDYYRFRLLVKTYLHDIFPEDDMVLWYCGAFR